MKRLSSATTTGAAGFFRSCCFKMMSAASLYTLASMEVADRFSFSSNSSQMTSAPVLSAAMSSPCASSCASAVTAA